MCHPYRLFLFFIFYLLFTVCLTCNKLYHGINLCRPIIIILFVFCSLRCHITVTHHYHHSFPPITLAHTHHYSPFLISLPLQLLPSLFNTALFLSPFPCSFSHHPTPFPSLQPISYLLSLAPLPSLQPISYHLSLAAPPITLAHFHHCNPSLISLSLQLFPSPYPFTP